ncbi:MAG: tetratricopeptide repeat protein [Sphingobacteriaceae bacterium]
MIRTLLLIFIFPVFVFGQKERIDSIYNELKKPKNDTTIMLLYDRLSDMMYMDQPDSAISCWERIISLAESCVGKYPASSLESKTIKGYHAYCLNNIAFFYYNRGLVSVAIEYFDRSLKTQEEINDKEGIAYSLNNLAFIYKNQGDEKKALEYFQRGLKIQEQIKDRKGSVTSLNNIGVIYHKRREIQKAMEIFQRALKLGEEIKFKEGIARSLNNIGNIYDLNGDPSITSSKEQSLKAGFLKAVDYYTQSLKIREEIGDKQGTANSLISIGKVYIKDKNYTQALKNMQRSLQLAKEIGYPQEIANSAEMLDFIYRMTGDYKQARENYELFVQMRDSLNNETTRKASIKQQLKHEYEVKAAADSVAHAKETEIKNAEIKVKKNQQYALFWGLGLVIVFALFMFNRFKVTQKQKFIIENQKGEVEEQKKIVEDKQKEILDSINYAKRIQYTLLAHKDFLKQHLPEHFIFFKPKDIVSGDFYWATHHNNKFYLAVCDSTGHGVPGAFMSLLNIGFLTEAINEKGIAKPNEVFDFVRERLINSISKEGQMDGFDGILICFDKTNNTITYASANNAPVLMHNGKFIELSTDKMPVGIGEIKNNFKLHTIESSKGDVLYLYTDGYADQFGGPKGKKFKYKQLNELLLSEYEKPLNVQHENIKKAFETWQGNLEQVDDVCILGIRI